MLSWLATRRYSSEQLTDVVLSIHFFTTLQKLGFNKLWIGFVSGKSYTGMTVYELSLQLGPDECKALPFFNAFTGCDHTFSMLDIGKKSGWNAWMKFPDATETMISLTESPHELTEDSLHMQRIEQLTVLMYSKKYSSVNEAFDATAGDIYYHKSCYHKLANAARAAKLKKSKVTTTSALPYDPFVMAKLISNVQNNESVMKLTDLRKFYSQQLQQVDSDCLKMEIPLTRFKEHLLMNLGDEWQAFTKGRDVLLSTKSKTSSLLSDSLTQDVSEDKAKKIVEVALLL